MEVDFATPLCIAMGNKKVGKIWTFSLPSFMTCPGASAWCRRHCYAMRFERLRPNCRHAYLRNLASSLDLELFANRVLDSLPEDAPLMRIHVGGDFYSPEYTLGWLRICQSRASTRFWSYTRSWVVPEILPALELLRKLPNVELFSSTDPEMPVPPDGWRAAFIQDDQRASGMLCRHQQEQASSCLECGYCFSRQEGDVVFKKH